MAWRYVLNTMSHRVTAETITDDDILAMGNRAQDRGDHVTLGLCLDAVTHSSHAARIACAHRLTAERRAARPFATLLCIDSKRFTYRLTSPDGSATWDGPLSIMSAEADAHGWNHRVVTAEDAR